MQSKEDLEQWYEKRDPWGYEINPDDLIRKENILEALEPYGQFKRALDIGCGEGFITRDLPADEIQGQEISDRARKRLPHGIMGVKYPTEKYDLVVATGVLYPQYDWRQILQWIKEHSSHIILVAGIDGWFVPELKELGDPVYIRKFPYRQYNQVIRIYEKTRS